MEKMMKEELMDGGAMVYHATSWGGTTKISGRRPPFESIITHKIRPNWRRLTHSVLTQLFCRISLLYFQHVITKRETLYL